jgi:hypothetical protein
MKATRKKREKKNKETHLLTYLLVCANHFTQIHTQNNANSTIKSWKTKSLKKESLLE